jgi:hypothetical protein
MSLGARWPVPSAEIGNTKRDAARIVMAAQRIMLEGDFISGGFLCGLSIPRRNADIMIVLSDDSEEIPASSMI